MSVREHGIKPTSEGSGTKSLKKKKSLLDCSFHLITKDRNELKETGKSFHNCLCRGRVHGVKKTELFRHSC